MISETKKQVLQLFALGRELYKNRDFELAMVKFRDACKLDPADGPSRVFFSRCKMYVNNPPPEDWDGVFEMTTK